MAIINLTNSGSRRSMTDASRWQLAPDRDTEAMSRPEPMPAPEPAREPERFIGPTPEIVGANTAEEIARNIGDDNVDTSLKDRIRRISRRPKARMDDTPVQEERRPRPRRAAEEERAELNEEAFNFTPAGPKGREKPESAPAERASGNIRQSARRREDTTPAPRTQVPARRTPTEPEVQTTGVLASESEVDMLRSEIEELRREMSDMRAAIGQMERPASSPKGLGAVERTMQRLAERMDRIDGGPPAQNVAIQDGRPTGGPRKGFFKSLFG